ncbi:MAG: DUF697 domain-containing protein [Schwartzia sp.]|nr:DUF697 domain-containing protein [Schwartzia sp. (in: firmicutes)]
MAANEELDYTSVEDLIKKMMTDFKDDMKSMGHVNIIIAGKTGVGKSTLINAAFRDHLAETGSGRPVTQECQLIEKEGVPIRIYDTVGLELNEEKKERTISDIKKIIDDNLKAGDPDKFIHCLWYCVDSNSDRFEDVERDFVRGIAENSDIPVLLVLTKSYLKSHAKTFAGIIASCGLPVRNVNIVLAESYVDEDQTFKAFGVKELVEATINELPEAARRAWTNAQRVSLVLKRREAENIIKQTVKMAFGTGFSPLPVSDAALLVPVQLSMFIRITNVYGIQMTTSLATGLVSGLLGVAGATYVGRAVVSGLLKLIPGLGTAVGGVISGATAATITWGLGRTYIEIMEKLFKGEITKDDLREGSDFSTKIKELLKENLSK